MGSLEDLFSRVERSGNTSYDEIVDWLSDRGRKNKNSFRNIGAILAEPFGIREEIKRVTDYPEAVKLKREAQSMAIKDQKTIKLANDKVNELESKQKQKGNLETLYRNKIKAAKTASELDTILSEFEPELDNKQVNRLKENIAQKKKDIRQERARELEQQQKKAKEERIRIEKEEKEAMQKAKIEAELERKRQANEIRLAAERRKEEERQAARELQKEIEKEERRIAEQIARESQ